MAFTWAGWPDINLDNRSPAQQSPRVLRLQFTPTGSGSNLAQEALGKRRGSARWTLESISSTSWPRAPPCRRTRSGTGRILSGSVLGLGSGMGRGGGHLGGRSVGICFLSPSSPSYLLSPFSLLLHRFLLFFFLFFFFPSLWPVAGQGRPHQTGEGSTLPAGARNGRASPRQIRKMWKEVMMTTLGGGGQLQWWPGRGGTKVGLG